MARVHMTYTDYLENEINEYKKEVAELTSKLEEYKKREEIMDNEMTKLDMIYDILKMDNDVEDNSYDYTQDDDYKEFVEIMDRLILHPELKDEF